MQPVYVTTPLSPCITRLLAAIWNQLDVVFDISNLSVGSFLANPEILNTQEIQELPQNQASSPTEYQSFFSVGSIGYTLSIFCR